MRWWLGLAFAAVGAITAAAVYAFVTDSSEEVFGDRATEIAVGRTVRIADRLGSASERGTQELLARNRTRGYAAWAFDREGSLLTSERVAGAGLGEIDQRNAALAQALDGGRYLAEGLPGNFTVVAAPIFRAGKVDGALLARASRPITVQRSIDKIREDSLTALAIAIGVGALVGFFVAGLIARRIKRLAQSAEHIAAGRFDIPLPSATRDEVGDLSEALDSMRERLRRSFNELASERDKLSAIFNALTDAVLVVGDDGEIRFSNPASARLTVEGPALTPELAPLLDRAAAEGHSERDILAVGERVYAVQASHLPAERAVLMVVRDRTEHLRRELAEREFVSNAAHELRNPIAGISSSIEVLQSGAKDDPNARERFLARLSVDADRLTRITQALLTLARVEATDETGGGVVSVAAAAAEASETLPAPEGIELRLDVSRELLASGDPVLLRQVLVGLLSNAYKHTPPPGTVELRARLDGDNVVVVEVADSGTGIAPEELGRVFERFYRGAGTLEKEGFGLGLPIAKRMVDVMGGEIGARSDPGRGSTFWVRLQAAQTTPTPVP